MSVVNSPLVPVEKILLPPLHIKLGLVRNLVKALNKDSPSFRRLYELFPGLSIEKISQGIYARDINFDS